MAYRAKQRPVGDDGDTFELGAFAHGPDAQRLAELLAERFAVWDSQVRGRLRPQVEVYPSSANSRDFPSSCVVDRPHSRIVLSWRAPTT